MRREESETQMYGYLEKRHQLAPFELQFADQVKVVEQRQRDLLQRGAIGQAGNLEDIKRGPVVELHKPP